MAFVVNTIYSVTKEYSSGQPSIKEFTNKDDAVAYVNQLNVIAEDAFKSGVYNGLKQAAELARKES